MKHKNDKEKKLRKKQDNGKITIGFFFSVQLKIIKELYSMHKLMTVMIILLSLIGISEQIIELKFLEYATNNVYDYFTGSSSEFGEALLYITGFMGCIFLVKLTNCVYKLIVRRYESDVVFLSEKKLIKKLATIPYENYESKDFYEKVNLAKQASGQYSQAVYGITQTFGIIFMIITYAIMLSRINIFFLLIIFISIYVNIALAVRITEKQMQYWMKHVSPDERSCGYFRSIYSGRVNQQNIQTNRTYTYFSKKFGYYNEGVRKNYLKLNIYSFGTELFSSAMFLISYLITAMFVGKGVVEGNFEIGYYSMIVSLLANMFVTIKRFSLFMLNRNWYVKVLDAYYSILEMPDNLNTGVNEGNNAISMVNVRYKYSQTENYALKGVDCSFKKGEKIALVGENGTGKSTLVSIVLGLLNNFEGSVRQSDIRKTAILQDFVQYQMTVRENIEIGCGGQHLSDEKITDILKKVKLYDLIKEMPDGINTKLGQLEAGQELSKGQWQRLAIARLLADEKADIWILDEPTAYLDPISEIEMYELIFSLSGERLVFFISHRLGFAKRADRIVVMNDGIIAETGTHSQLISNPDGLYSKMYEAQLKWYS